MDKAKIIIVDDEPGTCNSLYYILKDEGYEVTTSQSGEAALKSFKNIYFDVLITDVRMEKLSGIELLEQIRIMYPKTEVILITALPSLETSLPAIRVGAFAYITKPISVEQLKITVKKALERKALLEENEKLKEQIDKLKQK